MFIKSPSLISIFEQIYRYPLSLVPWPWTCSINFYFLKGGASWPIRRTNISLAHFDNESNRHLWFLFSFFLLSFIDLSIVYSFRYFKFVIVLCALHRQSRPESGSSVESLSSSGLQVIGADTNSNTQTPNILLLGSCWRNLNFSISWNLLSLSIVLFIPIFFNYFVTRWIDRLTAITSNFPSFIASAKTH